MIPDFRKKSKHFFEKIRFFSKAVDIKAGRGYNKQNAYRVDSATRQIVVYRCGAARCLWA